MFLKSCLVLALSFMGFKTIQEKNPGWPCGLLFCFEWWEISPLQDQAKPLPDTHEATSRYSRGGVQNKKKRTAPNQRVCPLASWPAKHPSPFRATPGASRGSPPLSAFPQIDSSKTSEPVSGTGGGSAVSAESDPVVPMSFP